MRLIIALFMTVLTLGFIGEAHSRLASEPQWRTLVTEAYPTKRDDIVFVNSLTGFYGTGKGKLYRTQDGGQSWHLVWSKPGAFIRALGFIDSRHGFLGNLGTGLADTYRRDSAL